VYLVSNRTYRYGPRHGWPWRAWLELLMKRPYLRSSIPAVLALIYVVASWSQVVKSERLTVWVRVESCSRVFKEKSNSWCIVGGDGIFGTLCGRKFAKQLVWDSFRQVSSRLKEFSSLFSLFTVPSFSCMKIVGSVDRNPWQKFWTGRNGNLEGRSKWHGWSHIFDSFFPPTFVCVFLPFDLPYCTIAYCLSFRINHIPYLPTNSYIYTFPGHPPTVFFVSNKYPAIGTLQYLEGQLHIYISSIASRQAMDLVNQWVSWWSLILASICI